MLGKIVYIPLYWLGLIWLKINLSALSVKIWPRNSYYFNRIIPLKSDIDLTLFSTKNFQTKDLLKIRKVFNSLKQSVPVFSELNIYDSATNLKFINPFELNRDPILKAHNPKHKDNASSAHKIVFIQRMLIADKNNLIRNPSAREKKWRGHFKDCSINHFPQENFTLEILIETLLIQVFDNLNTDYQNFLLKYLSSDLSIEKSVNEFYQSHTHHLKYFILTIPSQWIGASIASNRIDEDLKVIKNFNKIEKEILLEHIKWEHWGIDTQRHINFDDPTVAPHLKNLDQIANAINL